MTAIFSEKINSVGSLPEITQFQAVVINRLQVLLKWAVSDNLGSSYNINDYNFFIQRSYTDISEEDAYEEFTEPLEGITEYLDEPQSLVSLWRRIYYRLRMVHKVTLEEQILGPIGIHENAVPTQHALAMIHRHNMYLERFPVGSLTFAFIQRQWGQRCSCWNPVRSRSDDTECLLCAGTGWYFPFNLVPIKSYICLNPDVELVDHADFEIEEDDKHAWASNYPDFKKRDIIIVPGKNNSMYRVKNKKWLAQERNEIGIVQALHLTNVCMTEPDRELLHVNINDIKEYMDISWMHSRKTYFGCRTGLPDKPIKKDHGKKYYEK